MRYVVIGGEVGSAHDLDTHYVGAARLAQLYGVHFKDCLFAVNDDDPVLRGVRLEDHIVLRPRFDGNYTLEPTP